VRARFACNLDCFPRVSLSLFFGLSFETAFFIPHYLIAQLIPALRCCFLCYTLIYTVRSYQQTISQPRRFLCTFVPQQTQSRNECSSKTICTTARESHSLFTHDQNKTRPKHPSSFNAETRTTAEIETPHIRNIRQQIKHHLKLSNFIPIFEPNRRISTIVSHHVRSYAFDRTPPQLDKTIDQAWASGNKVPRVLAHIW
jgi:hypothetical protein